MTRQGKSGLALAMDDPLPGFPQEARRRAWIQELRNPNLSKEDQEEKRMKCAEDLNYGKMPQPVPWLKLWLGHGDIVIMRGAQFQKFFEHSVALKGLMRFALTCRTILPNHLKKSELPDYEVLPDTGHYDGSRISR